MLLFYYYKFMLLFIYDLINGYN